MNPPPAPAGPGRQAGTERTRLNAYKHGLTGQIHLLTAAEQTAFDAHCKSICEALAPVGRPSKSISPKPLLKTAGASSVPAPSKPVSSPPAGRACSASIPAIPAWQQRKTQPSFSSKIPSSKPAPGSPRTTISCFSLSTSSASAAPLRGIWPNSAPSAPNAKPPAIEPSKRPCS